jgi:hypothetical protein
VAQDGRELRGAVVNEVLLLLCGLLVRRISNVAALRHLKILGSVWCTTDTVGGQLTITFF